MANLFNKKVLDRHLEKHFIPEEKEKIDRISKWKNNLKLNKGVNEERLQGAFLNAIFGSILGYIGLTAAEDKQYTMKAEPTTEVDASKPDGSLGFFEIDGDHKTKAVIELKGPKISLDKKQKRSGKDYGTPIEQAFNYATKHDGCKWVIVSNMIEIRLYKYARGQGHYEEFLIPELDQEENFKKFHLLLSRENLINKHNKSLTERLSEETVEHEEDISTEFYNLYKQTRVELFEHLKENNPNYDQEVLLEKAQKFLDRIIFICFCEDLGLLPPEILHNAIESGKHSYSMSDTKIWTEIKGIFRAIDKGNPDHNINAYNGGLFQYDEDLDNLIIKNDFFDEIDELSAYDFDSDLDVNILGHIFEQSITDIEELKADIKDAEYDEEESKRKKDGIFYTPEYITKYIVENSVGQYLDDIKEELGYSELPDIDSASTPQVRGKYKKQHLEFYEEYEKHLRNIKILDPACGSGAFLNQAFDYLLQEHKWIQRQRSMIEEGQMNIFSQEGLLKQILQDNIYGVDLNQESVEITKLSLWLKTANKNKPLANLDNNIKCGNSLIDDPEVSGDKAFDWEEKFPEIMANGGFDVVIGNPPYVNSIVMENNMPKQKRWLKEHYSYLVQKWDLYVAFLEKGLSLLKSKGYLSYIIPDAFLTEKYANNLQEFILKEKRIKQIDYFEKLSVFEDAEVYNIILVLQNNKPKFPISKVRHANLKGKTETKNINDSLKVFSDFNKANININKDNTIQLGDICFISTGIVLNADEKKCKGAFKKEDLISDTPSSIHKRKIIEGKNVEKYLIKKYRFVEWDTERVPDKVRRPTFPELHQPNKLLTNKLGKLRVAYDKEGIVAEQTVRVLIKWHQLNGVENRSISHSISRYTSYEREKLEKISSNYNYYFLLGILNSTYIKFVFNYIRGKSSNDINPLKLREIPIPKTNLESQEKMNKKVKFKIKAKQKIKKCYQNNFTDLITKYTANTGPTLSTITEESEFFNQIYSGRARKVRDMTVNINDNILTLYSDKSSSGKYELFKFQVDDKYKRQYIKLYLENFTEEQLEETNNYSGSLPKRILQIEIPDFDKYNVVRKVVNEWNELQEEIKDLEHKIEKTDQEIDHMVYDLYDLTDEEIEIVEESLT